MHAPVSHDHRGGIRRRRLSGPLLAALSLVALGTTSALAIAPTFTIAPTQDEDTFVGSYYKTTVVASGGEAVIVEEPEGATWQGGILTYLPPGDAGTSFTVRVRASNDDGEVSAEWSVDIVDAMFLEFEDEDEFTENFFDPMTDEPDGGRRGEVDVFVDGEYLNFYLPGFSDPTFDSWCDFDRTPRVLSNTRVLGAYSLETRMQFLLPPNPANDGYHVGLVVDRGFADLGVLGAIRDGVEYERTCGVDGENSGTFFAGTWSIQDEDMFLRIETNGDVQRFFARADVADDWTLIWEAVGTRPIPDGVGFAAKNWGASQGDLTALFDYFDYGPLPGSAATIGSIPGPDPDHAFANGPYSVVLDVAGFPDPTLEVLSPAGATIEPNGVVSYDVTEDVGSTITFEIRATNATGTADAEWDVVVEAPVQLEFDEDQAEFDDEFFDPVHDASTRRDDVFAEVFDGFLEFNLPGTQGGEEDFDNWCGFDRTVRFLHNARVTGSYALETAVGFVTAPSVIDGGYHLGLCVDRGTADLAIFGPIRNGVEYERNCSQGGENTGTFFGGLFNDPGALAYLRIEASGLTQRFLARTSEDNPWSVISEVVGKRARPIGVGVTAKNWGSQSDIVTGFDYFNYGSPGVSFTQPEDQSAFEGGRYTLALDVSGFPTPELSVTQPAAGASINSLGILTVDEVPVAAGESFDVTVIASSSAGEVERTWPVRVVSAVRLEFDDQAEFDDNFYDPGHDTPAERRGEITTEVVDGALQVFLPGVIAESFDQWCGFDRAPRWLHEAGVTGSYAVETAAGFALAPPDLLGGYHFGLVVDRGTQDSAVVGPIRNGVEYERTCSLDGENTGTFFPDLFSDPEAVAYLRIEADGATQNILARTSPDDEWTEVMLVEGRRPAPVGVGIQTKNWGTAGDYIATFDYFEYGPIGGEEEVLTFVRGDADGSGDVNLTDGIAILNWSFQGAAEPACLDGADTDDSGQINLTDPVIIFQWLFLGGTDPSEPTPTTATYPAEDCGPDPTDDDPLGCNAPAAKCAS